MVRRIKNIIPVKWFLLGPILVLAEVSEIIKFDPEAIKASSQVSVRHFGHGGDSQVFELIRPDNTIRPSFNQTLCLHNYKNDKVMFSPCMSPIPWGMRWRQEIIDNGKMFRLKQGSYDDIYSSGYLSLTV